MNDSFVYINSNDSLEYYSTNKGYLFKIHLKSPLILTGSWQVALIEFYAQISTKSKASPAFRNSDKVLNIHCNFCNENIIHGELQPVLRLIPNSKASEFQPAFYLTVTKKELYEMEFIIKTSDGH